jgi:glycosyltransferase involved in cell wall biosynthesis
VKKKILFMAINMNVGGTEKALLNMLLEIPKEKYDVTLLLLERRGDFLNQVPNHVKVEVVKEYEGLKPLINQPIFWSSVRYLKQARIASSLKMFFLYLASKMSKTNLAFFKSMTSKMKPLETDYDVAVAYAGPMDFISFFVANKVQAKKKVQWIHFDVTKIGFNTRFASKLYQSFNKIFVVSNQGKEKLMNKLPTLKERIETFSNITSKNVILKLAEEGKGFNDSYEGVRILTVGRLSKEKGQDLTISVLKKLKESGYPVRWYCIGEGQARKEYEDLIREYGIVKDYIFLGSHSNPYPFMKQCDFYVQPSRYEGYCITLAEARCFDHPIITTNFTGAKEQIKDKVTGLIVEFNADQMYEAIKRLLDDPVLRKRMSKNLQSEVIDSTGEINKFYQLADSL